MNEPSQADAQALDALNELLAKEGDTLSIPYSALAEQLATIAVPGTKLVKQLQARLLKQAAKSNVNSSNLMDWFTTTMLASLNQWQDQQRYMLTHIATRSGMIGLNDPLEAALIAEAVRAPEMAYAGTLVLAVKEAIPYFEQLIEVLREIRDRMPAQAIAVKGETPEAGKVTDFEAINKDTEHSELIGIPWKVV